MSCSVALLVAQQPETVNLAELDVPGIMVRISQSNGEEKVQAQLELLKRMEATLDQRQVVAEELIRQQKDSGNTAILAEAYAGLGRVQAIRGNIESAIEAFSLAAEYARADQSSAQLLFRVLCNQATFSNALGKREQALTLLHEALEVANGDEQNYEIPFAYNVLAHVSEAAGAVEKAYENFHKAFESAIRSGKTELACQAGINIVELAISEGNSKLATEYMQAVEGWIEKSSDPKVRFLGAIIKQDVLRLNGDARGAAEELIRMVDQLPESVDRQQRGSLLLSLVACQIDVGEYTKAIETAGQAGELLQPIFRSWTIAQLHRARAEFGAGNAATALETVDQLLADNRLVPAHRIQLLILRSSILASLSRFQESLDSLTECRKLEDERDTQRAQELAQFIKADFENRQRDLELSTAKAREAGAKAKAQLSDMAADHEAAEAARARLMRNISILAAIVSVAIISLYLHMSWSRRVSEAIVQRERELNDKLKLELAKQAAELKDQVAKSQNLEVAIERKFRDEAIGKLTGGVAHDFNNLLSVILHSTELIRTRPGDLPADVSELLEAINTAAESGTSLVNQLMAYTRQQPLVAKPIRVSDWLSSTRKILRQTIGQDVSFIERDNSQSIIVCTDATRLTTTVINLLANARDSLTARGNQIEFSIEKIDLDVIAAKEWNNVQPGRYCLFQVRDDGIGMSQHELARACEPFYTTKLPGAGTGLGLSSVLGFVRQSGGDFRLSSQVNIGTTAAFLIPVAEGTIEVPADTTRESSAEAKEKRSVLLVEDQEPVRKVLATGLTAMGYKPIVASSADEAIGIIERSGMPEIVLSDVRMPGSMDGLELRKWLINKDPKVRVVLMSGYQEFDVAQDEGMILLAKPVKLNELRRLLAEC